MLYNIFFKLLKTRRREYVLVIFGGIFIMSLIFFTTSVESIMILIDTGKKARITTLVRESEKVFLLCYALLMILMILILLSYIRKRAYDYSILEMLGIQKKHKYMFIGLEYLGIVVCSIVGGELIGIVEVEIIKRCIIYRLEESVKNIFYGWSPFIFTLIIGFIIFGLGFMVCDQMISCLGISYVIAIGKKSGRKIQYSFKPVAIGIGGIILALFSITTYWGKTGSVIPFILAAVGLYFVMTFTGSNYLHILRKQEQKYFKKILWLDGWYNHFFDYMNITYIATFFVFIILFDFGLSIMDNVPIVQSEIFPYDIVWCANEDDKMFLNKLKKDFGVKLDTKPCVRVVSGDYGEHIGVSKSVYEGWTGEKINIKNKEIYVVYQRDRESMGTIGIDYGKRAPRIYIGNAEWDIWNAAGPKILPSNQFTREYEIVGEEQKILTGDFENPAIGELKGKVYEEVLVFSDEEFTKIRKSARGANLVVMMKIPMHYNQVKKEVYNYAKIHSQINFFDSKKGNLIYEKQKCIMKSRQEKMFNVVSLTIDIMAMFMGVIFILIEKIQSDYSEIEWKYRFYKNCGMPLEKRKKNIFKEVLMTEKIVICCGTVLGMLAIIIKILFKSMSLRWSVIYFFATVFLCIIISAIMHITMKLMARSIFKKIEGNS